MKNKLIAILVLMLGFIGTAEMSFASASVQQEMSMGGSIDEFKTNYIPEQWNPTPEWMIFVDLGVLFLLLVVGLFFVIKKKSHKAMTIMAIITFTYLGFIRGGCICPVGAISNVTMGIMDPYMVGLASFIIFMLPLIIAFIAGRVFCSSGCPLGAVQQLLTKKKKTKKLPKKLNTALKVVPILMLLATIYYAIQSSCFLICQLEPYKVIFFQGQTWFEQILAFIVGNPMEPSFLLTFGIGTWLYLVAVLVLGYWVPRPFCRFLCPYGVLLGAVSVFSVKQRKINKENCVYCGLCAKVCPTQAITIDRKAEVAVVSNYDCIQCNKCNDSCKKDAF